MDSACICAAQHKIVCWIKNPRLVNYGCSYCKPNIYGVFGVPGNPPKYVPELISEFS